MALLWCAAASSVPTPAHANNDWWTQSQWTEGTTNYRARLWVSPTAGRLRGMLLTVQNFAEPEFVTDPAIRAAAADLGLAIVYVTPNNMGFFDPPADPATKLTALLQRVADASGFPELAHAPLFLFGHSAAGLWDKTLAWHQPGRVVGVIHFKSGQLVPPSWATESLVEVPVLVLSGEFEEFGPNGPHGTNTDWEVQWRSLRDTIRGHRTTGHRMALAVEPGGAHYGWTGRQAALTAQWLRSVAATRLPAGSPLFGAPRLSTPAPGWLVDDDIKAATPMAPAPEATYPGATDRAYWLPDEAAVTAWRAHHEGQYGKTNHTLRFTNVSFPDGERDVLNNSVYDSTRHEVTVTATSSAGRPVQYELLSGPAVQVAENRFRVVGSLWNYNGANDTRLRVRAFSSADSTYRYAERTGEVRLSANTGSANTITFGPLGDVNEGARPITLTASASSGLPVEFSVIAGPAIIQNGNTLVLQPLPPGSGLDSVEVIVNAGQWGGGGVATATSVERRFRVLRTPRAAALPKVRPVGAPASGSLPVFRFATAAGQRYQFQFVSDLQQAWGTLSAPVGGTGEELSVVPPQNAPATWWMRAAVTTP